MRSAIKSIKSRCRLKDIKKRFLHFYILSIQSSNVTLFFNIVNCPAGSFQNSALNKCVPCPKGSYQNQEAQTQCIPCPHSTSTREKGGAKTIFSCKGSTDISF